MRKSLAAAIICFLLSLAAVPAAVLYVDREKDAVEILEVPVLGDVGKAAGVTLEFATHWDGRLLWNTEYMIGSGQGAESVFAFSSQGESWERPPYEGMDIYGISNWGIVSDVELNPDEVYLPEAVKDVASRTEPGKVHEEVILLADYYEYYPFVVDIRSERQNVAYYSTDVNSDIYAVAKLFAVPVDKEERVALTVEKDKEGNCINVDCKGFSDNVGIEYACAFGEKGCWLAFRCIVYPGGALYPGKNYGVYYLPYVPDGLQVKWRNTAAAQAKTIDSGQAGQAWELEKDVVPIDMALDEEKEILYLVVQEADVYFLNVFRIEGEGLRLMQSLPVLDRAGEVWRIGEEAYGEGAPWWAGITLEEGGVLLTWQDGAFAFVEENGGQYSLFCRDVFPDCVRLGSDETYNIFPWEHACAFDGERLAMAAFSTWSGIDAGVGVFERDGLVYYGEYANSGSAEDTAGYSSIHPQGCLTGMTARPERPLKIRFSE